MIKKICLAVTTCAVLSTQSLGLNFSTNETNQVWNKYAGKNHILFLTGRKGGGYHKIGLNYQTFP